MHPDETISMILIAIWFFLGLIGFCIFSVVKSAALKRKLWALFVIVVGVLFVAYSYYISADAFVLYVVSLFVILISILNIKLTKFCDSCGKMVISQAFFARPKYCSKCGQDL